MKSIVVLAGAASLGVGVAHAQDAGTQWAEQSQRISVLGRKFELQEEAAKAAAASAPVPRASARGFQIQSADGAHTARFRGLVHFDGRWFDDDISPETSDTWLLRRVRPTLEGTIHRIYDFRITPDFAGGRAFLLDAYLTARLKPWFTVQAGKFKVPVGLERLASANEMRFIERAYPTSLLPNRDLGVQVTGDLARGAVNYSLGYYNGVTDGGSADGGTPADAEADTAGDIAARVFVQPFLNSDNFALRGIGIGIAGTHVDVAGSPTAPHLATYRTPGQQGLFQYRANNGAAPLNNATYANGTRTRVSPQGYYYLGSLGFLAEYAKVSQDIRRQVAVGQRLDAKLETKAFHIQASWFITGEAEAFRGFTPGSTFAPGRPGIGAWELIARHHVIAFDKDAFTFDPGVGFANSFANPVGRTGKASGAINPRKATSTGVGVNWYINEAFKWQLNYELTRFDGGGANSADQSDERAILTRFAVSF